MLNPELQTNHFRFLEEGRNCWRIAHARQLSVLIDAQNYYSALLSALLQAKRSIMIVGWDFDSRIELAPGVTLGQALEQALAQSPALEIYVLCWDFAMIYTFERQLFPSLSRTFRHPRIHFELDGAHPPGASHHQKIVAIDGQIAFCGGLDLCSNRWDTRGHLPKDSRRKTPDGRSYTPFHDIQCVVTGEAAARLAEVAICRWQTCTQKTLGALFADTPIWPTQVPVHFQNLPVGISRTVLDVRRTPDAREAEALYLDAIARARHFIYIECEYLTSRSVTDAMAARLRETHGPEFVLIVPRLNSGWLEQQTMGVLRDRAIRILKKADHEGRLSIYYPVSRAVHRDIPISVHSKLMIVDDELIRIGSSNLSNRSMGFDSECDLAWESRDDSVIGARITEIRLELLSEHLGITAGELRSELNRQPAAKTMQAAIERLRMRTARPRDLLPFVDRTPDWIDRIVPDADILDPESPLEEDPYFSPFLPKNRRRSLDQRFRSLILRMIVLDLVLIALLRGKKGSASAVLAQNPIKRKANGAHPKASWLGGHFLLFYLGSLAGVPADLSVFGSNLYYGSKRAGRRSFYAYMSLSCLSYAFGRMVPDSDGAQKLRTIRVERHYGSFWPGFLLHLSLLSRFERVSFLAGRRQVRALPFLFGTAIAQGVRCGTIRTYSRAVETYVHRPSKKSLAALIGTTVAVACLYRWSSRRVLPSYKAPSKSVGKSTGKIANA